MCYELFGKKLRCVINSAFPYSIECMVNEQCKDLKA